MEALVLVFKTNIVNEAKFDDVPTGLAMDGLMTFGYVSSTAGFDK